MKNSVIKTIINNTFLPNYGTIINYFEENNLVYNYEDKIDGGFTLDFSGSDTKELFEQNLKTEPDNWYYRTHEVKYTLNSLGYRTKEFDDIDWKESIVVFGCSYVFADGVPDEHTIPYFLEKLSGRPVINMGMGGSSIQTVLHNSIILNDSKYPTPKAIVNIWTNLNRYQLYRNNSTDHMGEWDRLNQEFGKKENLLSFNLMNIKMIRNLWKNKTIYYEATLFGGDKLINRLDKEIYCEFFEYDGGLARDLGHNGPVKNLEIARGIYKKIKPQLTN
jgi:hypothetical protein